MKIPPKIDKVGETELKRQLIKWLYRDRGGYKEWWYWDRGDK